jgi:hypothetical protein
MNLDIGIIIEAGVLLAASKSINHAIPFCRNAQQMATPPIF